MKVRNGFVSNSSSSSFIIPITDLFLRNKSYDINKTNTALDNIIEKAHEEGWAAKVKAGYLIATTYMDNFDLIEYVINKTEKSNQYSFIIIPAHTGFKHGDIKVLENIINRGFYNLDHMFE